MIINSVLMILSCIALYITMNYVRERRSDTLYSKSIFIMGIFAFVICISYSILGISTDYNIAGIVRILGIFGIDCFLIAEILMMSSQLKINHSMLGIIDFVYISVSVLDMLFFGNPNVAEFTRYNGRTCYYANRVWQRTFHSVFIMHIACGLIIVWFLCWKRSNSKREKKSLLLIFWSNIVLLLSTLPDTFLPLMGYPSWPSTPLGVFFAYIVVMYTLHKYPTFEITAKHLYSHIYQNTNIGFVAFKPDFTLAAMNECTSKLLGTTAKGAGLSQLFFLTGEEEERLREVLVERGHIEEKLEARNTNVNTLVTLNVEYNRRHSPCYIAGTIIDLSNEELMLKELYRLDEAKTLFLMHMSHEIRTPVNTLLGMNEMIIRKTDETRIREYAENVKSSCNILISIINDILDFSKIESGELTLSESPYSLCKMVNELICMIEERTNKKGLSMLIDIDRSLPDNLYGDEVRIRQIVTNLLTNAVKYTDYGSVKLKVTSAGRKGDVLNLRIDVIDTGKGIREEDRAKLFDAFQRVDEKKNRHIEGTGLGLSITSHFVSMMGGKLNVESEYGKGSDFYVILPQKVLSDEKIGKVSKKNKDRKENPARKRIVAPDAKVLIVDDNDMNLTVISLLLEETGMSVDLALDGKVALAKMKEKQYDLILLDHMMPEMDGISVLKNMKQERLQEKVPVIALTANAISGARQMYLEAGFDDYISKPVEMEKLQELLLKWLPMAYTEQEA